MRMNRVQRRHPQYTFDPLGKHLFSAEMSYLLDTAKPENSLFSRQYLQNQVLLSKASEEFKARLAENPFVSLIPDDVKPPLTL
jgi:hypothetical protein